MKNLSGPVLRLFINLAFSADRIMFSNPAMLLALRTAGYRYLPVRNLYACIQRR